MSDPERVPPKPGAACFMRTVNQSGTGRLGFFLTNSESFVFVFVKIMDELHRLLPVTLVPVK